MPRDRSIWKKKEYSFPQVDYLKPAKTICLYWNSWKVYLLREKFRDLGCLKQKHVYFVANLKSIPCKTCCGKVISREVVFLKSGKHHRKHWWWNTFENCAHQDHDGYWKLTPWKSFPEVIL